MIIGKWIPKGNKQPENLTVETLKEQKGKPLNACITYNLLSPAGFKVVYSGGHHRVWCNGDIHMQQTVKHKELPLDYYQQFLLKYASSCDCYLYGNNRCSCR